MSKTIVLIYKLPTLYEILHEINDWLVLPYELTGLSKDELEKYKSWTLPILDKISP